jgi:hypothetical protein
MVPQQGMVAEHACACALQPHWFGLPPPPQGASGGHVVPQELTVRTFPQLSGAVTAPQVAAIREQKLESDSGTQPVLQTLLVQVPPVHGPQFAVLIAPQLSLLV